MAVRTVRSSTLRPFFPNEAAVLTSTCKPIFNWFLFGQRRLDLKNNLFFVSVPPTTRFFDVSVHNTKAIKDTSTSAKKMDSKEYPRFLILSDPHNKKVLCSKMGECAVGCSSSKEKLSAECKMVADKKHIRRLFLLAVKLGFDGVATHHVCCNRAIKVSRFPVSQECTFVALQKKMTIIRGDECRIIRFSKQYNTRIRKTYRSFPTNVKIDDLRKTLGCTKTTKLLYRHLMRYAKS